MSILPKPAPALKTPKKIYRRPACDCTHKAMEHAANMSADTDGGMGFTIKRGLCMRCDCKGYRPARVSVRRSAPVARKAEAPPVPRTAATRLTEAAAGEKAKTPSEIIERMAAARGKTHLTTLRKGP